MEIIQDMSIWLSAEEQAFLEQFFPIEPIVQESMGKLVDMD
jgi:hypothetical protein